MNSLSENRIVLAFAATVFLAAILWNPSLSISRNPMETVLTHVFNVNKSISDKRKPVSFNATNTTGTWTFITRTNKPIKSKNPTLILLAPFGPLNGLNRRLFHLGPDGSSHSWKMKPNPLDICGSKVSTAWNLKLDDSFLLADIVVFDLVHIEKNIREARNWLAEKKAQKPVWQFWVGITTENTGYYPYMYPFAPLRKKYPEIDAYSTNRLDSDIPIVETGASYGATSATILQMPRGDQIPKILLMYSNCKTPGRREDYIKKIISKYPSIIENRGRCWGGRSSSSVYNKNGVKAKMELSGKYMFSMNMENANVKDYVSEKVYQTFSAGSIPIFKGAPNAKQDFIPCSKCVIWVDDYPSEVELVQYLRFVMSNKTEYDSFFEWKKNPSQATLSKIGKLNRLSLDTQICRIVNAGNKKNVARHINATKNGIGKSIKPKRAEQILNTTSNTPVAHWLPFDAPCPDGGASMDKPLYGCTKAKRVYSTVSTFTGREAQSIIRRYRSVMVLGDSLTRHVFNGLLILVNGDAAKGALRGAHTFFKEPIALTPGCEYEGLLTEKKQCFDEMAWDNIYGKEVSPRAEGCPASDCNVRGGCRPDLQKMTGFRRNGSLILWTWYEATCRTHALEIASRLTSRDAIIVGEGIHDNFNMGKFKSYVSDKFINVVRKSKARFLVLGALASGPKKPTRYIGSQGTAAAKSFNAKLDQYAKEKKFETLHSLDMTLNASSFDGTHFGLDVNLMRASQVLEWLQKPATG